MSQERFFCSELSRAAGERTFGTASVGEVWLLVEYPFAWGPRALDDSALAPAVKEHFGALLKQIPRSRLLFVKQDPVCREDFQLIVVRSRERRPYAVRLRLRDYKDIADVDVPAIAAGRTTGGGELTREPLYLVCTHGRRDKCCAKFGNPLFKHLRARLGDSVWQSSHVGGDRFAANLLCFPHGLFYAHLDEESGAGVVEEYARGRVVLDKYRGRSCYAYAAQAAEFFVRTATGLGGLDALSYAGGERLGENRWRVSFSEEGTGMIYEARVACRESEFQTFVTCHAAQTKRVAQFFLEDLSAKPAPADPG